MSAKLTNRVFELLNVLQPNLHTLEKKENINGNQDDAVQDQDQALPQFLQSKVQVCP